VVSLCQHISKQKSGKAVQQSKKSWMSFLFKADSFNYCYHPGQAQILKDSLAAFLLLTTDGSLHNLKKNPTKSTKAFANSIGLSCSSFTIHCNGKDFSENV
jgi:hypothetical protein